MERLRMEMIGGSNLLLTLSGNCVPHVPQAEKKNVVFLPGAISTPSRSMKTSVGFDGFALLNQNGQEEDR